MTVIQKVTAHGFKSFAKHTEMIFGDGFNSIIGPNGAGKCIEYNSIIQLADGSLVKIGDLVEERIKTNKLKKIEDGFIIKGDKTKILTLDTNSLKIKPKYISAYIKRRSPELLIRIKTRSGREIIATEYHPLFTLKENRIETIKVEDLKEGVKVAVPRNLNINTNSKIFIELIDLIEEKDNIYVPFNKTYLKIVKSLKKSTWKKLAEELKIPLNSIKGLLDKQAINFFYLMLMIVINQPN